MNFPEFLLSEQQIDFLQKNFLIYDPDSYRCSKEFSTLNRCQVFLIGEEHNLRIHRTLQTLFLKNFCDDISCLLVEGLPPGIKLDHKDIHWWKHLPKNLTVIGSDMRMPEITPENYGEWSLLKSEMEDAVSKKKQYFTDHHKEIAAIFKKSLPKEVIGTNQLIIEWSDQLKIDVLDAKKTTLIKGLEIDKLNKKFISCNFNKVCPLKWKESNNALFQEIQKATKQYSRVFVIWGEGHFLSSDEFFSQLEASEIRYSVLMLNDQRVKQATEESMWRENMIYKKLGTISESPDGNSCLENELFIEEPLQSEYPQEIQKYFQDEESRNRASFIEAKDLLDMCTKWTQLKFPAQTPIAFEICDSADHSKAMDLINQQKNHEIVFRNVLNNILIFQNKSWSKDKSVLSKIFWSVGYKEHKPFLITYSDNEIVLKIEEPDNFVVTPSYLFKGMLRQNINHLKILPNKGLIFTDITSQEKNSIKADQKKNFHEFISSHSPKNTQVTIEGDFKIELDIRDDAMCLSSNNGIEIKIIPTSVKI